MGTYSAFDEVLTEVIPGGVRGDSNKECSSFCIICAMPLSGNAAYKQDKKHWSSLRITSQKEDMMSFRGREHHLRKAFKRPLENVPALKLFIAISFGDKMLAEW